jgi:signal transduction histidine kinase/CheY-like chemotaxis protein
MWNNICHQAHLMMKTSWNWMLDHTILVRSILYHNHIISALFLLSSVVLVSFIPLIIFSYGEGFHAFDSDAHYNSESVHHLKDWLLTSTSVSGPMLIEYVLHYINNVNSKSIDWCGFLSRGLLLLSLIGPNIVLYCVSVTTLHHISPVWVSLLQTSLMFAKDTIFMVSLLMSMFGHKMESVGNASIKLKISVEDWTVSLLCFWLLQRILFVTSSVTTGPSGTVLELLGIIFAIVTLIMLFYVIVRVILFLFEQQVWLSFASHEHLADFYNSLVLLYFLIIFVILKILYQHHEHTSNGVLLDDHSVDLNHLIVSLYVQIAVTIALTVIHGRSYVLLAEIKQQKLNTRLNLIRYVSHEMRTPLNTAFLGLEMMAADLNAIKAKYSTMILRLETASNMLNNRGTFELAGDVHELHDTMKQVRDSCKVAVETLDDLLTFDKLDESKLVIEVTDMDPWVFLSDASKPFELNARQLDVNFSIAIEDNDDMWLRDHYIKGDKFKLAQVIRNLCSNALKFTPAHGFVDVRLTLVSPNESKLGRDLGPAVRMAVRDSGAGISAENQRKLFGQYVQFNAGKLQQGKGSGLGLWISKSIVEMHGGKIWAKSDGEGKGTIFAIDLPVFAREYEYQGNNLGNLLSAITMRRANATASSNILARQSNNSSTVSGHGNSENNSVSVSFLNTEVVLKEAAPGTTFHSSLSRYVSVQRADVIPSPPMVMSSAEADSKTPPSVAIGPKRLLMNNNNVNSIVNSVSNSSKHTNNSSVAVGSNDYNGIENTINSSVELRSAVMQTVPEFPMDGSSSSIRSQSGSPNTWSQRLVSLVAPGRKIDGSSVMSSPNSSSNSLHSSHSSSSFAAHNNKVRPLPSSVDIDAQGATAGASVGDVENQIQSPNQFRKPELVLPIPTSGDDSGSNNNSSSQSSFLSSFYGPNNLFAFNRNNSNLKAGIASVSKAPKEASSITVSTGVHSYHWGELSMAAPSMFAASTPTYNYQAAANHFPSSTSENDATSEGVALRKSSDHHPGSQSSASSRTQLYDRSADTKCNTSVPTIETPITNIPSWDNGLHILIVDDTGTNRKMLKKLLQSCGHTVSEAVDGIDCLEKLDYYRPDESLGSYGSQAVIEKIDIVLMDEHMPRMEGPECVATLKRKGFARPVFAITGSVAEDEIEYFERCGATAVFAKPLKLDLLKDAVQHYFALR